MVSRKLKNVLLIHINGPKKNIWKRKPDKNPPEGSWKDFRGIFEQILVSGGFFGFVRLGALMIHFITVFAVMTV